MRQTPSRNRNQKDKADCIRLFTAVTKCLTINNLREERIILVYDFRGFSPCSLDTVILANGEVEHCDSGNMWQTYLPHGGHKAKRQNGCTS
jgi:hypothetical protein